MLRHSSRVGIGVYRINAFRSFTTSSKSNFPKVNINGVNLNYKIVGEGAHPVFCIPGLIGSIDLDYGEFFCKADKKKFKWIVWDPPGYGASRPPQRDFSDDCYLNDAIIAGNLMDKLGIEKYSVLGWSQGAGTSMFLAAERPDNVVNLVTVGAKACYDERMLKVFEIMSSIDHWPREYLQQRLKVYEMSYLKKMLKENLENVRRSIKSNRGDYLQACFDKIVCPVLYVHGTKDNKVPLSHARQLARRTKNARVATIPGAGHELLATHSQDFMKHASPFFLNESDDQKLTK